MDYGALYINFLKKFVNVKRPLTVVLDASNGPTGMIVRNVWEGTEVKTIIINDNIDPDFSAHGPNPLSAGAADDCKSAILKNKADLGVIFDADGDRAVFLDDTGFVIPACFVATLLFNESKPPYVADELIYQSLKMLKIFSEKDLLPSRVGSRFVKEEIKKSNAFVGAEYSGHYYFKDFFGADSGIFTAIIVINFLSKINQSFSEWKNKFGEYQMMSEEISIEGKDLNEIYKKAENIFASSVKQIEKRDGMTFVFENCWINVRPSNTEPILRIIAGGSDEIKEKIDAMLKAISKVT